MQDSDGGTTDDDDNSTSPDNVGICKELLNKPDDHCAPGTAAHEVPMHDRCETSSELVSSSGACQDSGVPPEEQVRTPSSNDASKDDSSPANLAATAASANLIVLAPTASPTRQPNFEADSSTDKPQVMPALRAGQTQTQVMPVLRAGQKRQLQATRAADEAGRAAAAAGKEEVEARLKMSAALQLALDAKATHAAAEMKATNLSKIAAALRAEANSLNP